MLCVLYVILYVIRTVTVFKQAIERALMSNRIHDYNKVATEIQSRLALVIVQGSIAPVPARPRQI